jgi:ribosomal protein S18 acetylase RimI-like enzyme
MNKARLIADQWLSKQLGKAAYHLNGKPEDIAPCIVSLSARLSQGVPFADAKIPVDQVAAGAALQSLGFKLIDTNLQFEMRREKVVVQDPADITFATPRDADAIGAIAEEAFEYDRFHRDPAIPDAIASSLKRAWVQNFFAGARGEWMVTARRNSAVTGFLQLLKGPEGKLVIDLIAVGAQHRGAGLARAMIAFAARSCPDTGALIVGTQVSNAPSVRLYESLGFRLTATQYVFHRHGAAIC